jgi:hypothetical protein
MRTGESHWCPTCGGVLSLTSWYTAVCMRLVDTGGCGRNYQQDSGGRWVLACSDEHRRGERPCGHVMTDSKAGV